MEDTAPQASPRNNTSKILIPVAIVIIALGIIAFVARGQQKGDEKIVAERTVDETTITETVDEPTTAPEAAEETSIETSRYKDGTYSATGNYISPGGAEELGVQVTLKEGVITDANVQSRAERPNTIKFQGIFVTNYKPLVVGKNIDGVQLTTVSGSSLSPKGFNEALAEIKAQARS